MITICVAFIAFIIILMCTSVVSSPSTVEGIVASMRRFFSHDQDPILRCVDQAIGIRSAPTRKAYLKAYHSAHPYAQALASSDEGPELALSVLWDEPMHPTVQSVVDFTDGEVLSVERIK